MADSLFPFIDTTQTMLDANSTALPMPHEYAWDYDNDCMKLVDGKPQVVSGAEAIKVWAWNALQTDRYRYKAYTWDYGHELKSLFGLDYSDEVRAAEAERFIRECLSVNPYIKDISDFNISFKGDTLSASFRIKTPYGEVEMNV